MKKYLLSLILMLPLSIFVVAQDNESEDEVEEVVVTGIKKSLISAIDIKRNNVGVVDAITAEDFGKFPDNNLAESLARVVGIGIDRIQLVKMEQNLNLTLFIVQILGNLVSQYLALFKIEIILKKAQENLTGLRLRI